MKLTGKPHVPGEAQPGGALSAEIGRHGVKRPNTHETRSLSHVFGKAVGLPSCFEDAEPIFCTGLPWLDSKGKHKAWRMLHRKTEYCAVVALVAAPAGSPTPIWSPCSTIRRALQPTLLAPEGEERPTSMWSSNGDACSTIRRAPHPLQPRQPRAARCP